MIEVPLLDEVEWARAVRVSRARVPGDYRAMYSSWFKGIVTDPALMVLPIDDHLVHRGDGIFEAARLVAGAFFDLQAHLERLRISADRVALKLPFSLDQIRELCVQTARASGLREAALRLFVGRGPGTFSPNPYDSKESQLYIVITGYNPMPETFYQHGARAIISKIPQKDPFFARIKSCNYLPNALMKKEAVDAGVEFSLGCSAEGVVLEGPTENLAIISHDGNFCAPKFEYTLRGTTLITVMDFLRDASARAMFGVREVQSRDISCDDLFRAKEAFMIGTTLEVLPVVEIEGRRIGGGRPGPIATKLRENLNQIMRSEPSKRTNID